jgi:hypothetical protein
MKLEVATYKEGLRIMSIKEKLEGLSGSAYYTAMLDELRDAQNPVEIVDLISSHDLASIGLLLATALSLMAVQARINVSILQEFESMWEEIKPSDET